ncbi:MAG: hypothetical protein KGH87_07130, partial [Thaumarchaeota archaeon]|nr:hypothetical protein [Nitrososphaerota archaeon]
MTAAIVLNPTHGAVGTIFLVTGTGFQAAADTITFTFAGVSISANEGTITDDGAGNFTAHITAPAGLVGSVQGAHAVVATDAHTNSGSANFTIDPKLVLSPTTGNVGDSDTITLTGYAASSAITVSFGATSCTPVSGTTDAHGALTTTYTVPAATADSVSGAHTVTVADASANTANAPYTITPKVVISPLFGNTGVTVTATLSGYAATSALTATFNGVSVSLSAGTTDAHGVLAPTFTVPTKGGLDGANTVSIHDAVPNTATTTFELYLAASGISMNSTFTHLNGRNLYIKPTTTSREREAIVNITFDATDE